MTLRDTLCGLAAVALALIPSAAGAHEEPKKSMASVLSETPHLAVIRPAPDFTLLDTNEQPVQLAQLRGRTVLLAFGYTTCKSAVSSLKRTPHPLGRQRHLQRIRPSA